jgi:alpha-tubulin suppressor-like RCC1 family protein
VALAAAGVHNCAIATDGTAYCWGSNQFGALGTATGTEKSDSAVLVSGNLRFRSIAAGGYSVCGVERNSGAGYCWGGDYLEYGVLGNGAIGHRSAPTLVAGNIEWRTIQPETALTCGLAEDGALYCWGAISGTVWRNVLQGEATTTPARMQLAAPASAMRGTCLTFAALRAACVTAVTTDPNGRFFLATSTVPEGPEFPLVAGSVSHACGMTAAARLYCWGYNAYGQVGDGTLINRDVPVPVSGDIPWAMP